MNRFEELDMWKEARILANEIYSITQVNFKNDFELSNQIRRSSGLIMDNIAEGHERGVTREFIYFLGISKGACGEVRSQLYRVYDRNYVNEQKFEELRDRAERISKMITGFIKYLRNSDIKNNVEEPGVLYGFN